MKNKKLAVLKSVISLLLCVSMLAGTTFAWFTDGVRSGKNTIVAGNLDVELEYMTANGEWLPVTADTNVFEENTLWEPGHTEVVYLRVSNAGTLALKYQLGVNIAAESGSVNVAGEEFVLSDYIEFAAIEDVQTAFASRDAARAAVQSAQILSTGYTQDGELLPDDPADYVAFVVYMPETVGNEANYRTGELPPRIELGISLFATQTPHEPDSFGADYDWAAGFPEVDLPAGGKADVTVENGATAADVTISGGNVSAEVPAGVQVEDGTTELSLSVTEMSASGSNVTLATNEVLKPVDVHVSGVSASNTTPMKVRLDGFAAIGLNEGNLKLYHVENGETVAMTRVSSEADFSAHNQFTYDPATGNIVLYLATFSEITAVANTENAWKGKFDYDWYTNAVAPVSGEGATIYTIANADQLAAFGAIVGGMKKVTDRVDNKYIYSDEVILDEFAGDTVKLIADINLGDAESKNNPDLIFYPIGYYNNEGTYERTNTDITSGLRNFEGTFDGNGHSVSNFYHNTWEMKGDHDWYTPEEQYYRDGMGLFGRVYKATIKNLTVKNFKSDGEIATTGVIAAYADGATFENIAIFDCNPRVYNIGNGGIVGCVGWYAKEASLKTTFKNITVDKTNKISALWGSYDVACGGIVGQYYPTSGQTGAGTPKNGGIDLVNCHVSAQMDVYNDVCANYQYYAYRYAGMIIGSVRENVTIDGHSYPKMDGITAKGCTVHFGTWNDYYYCEIIDNTTASYTHDYQMSRLTEIKAINGTTVTYLDGTTGTVPASGRANYVIVNGNHATENATCYHFKDGAVWTHDMGGIQTGIDEDGDGQDDLKEDKQHIYLEFNNLVTGYGWGVSTKAISDFPADQIKILDNFDKNKFEKNEALKDNYLYRVGNQNEFPVGKLFQEIGKDVVIDSGVHVSVTPLDESVTMVGNFVRDESDWTKSTLHITGSTGLAKLTIQDYNNCEPFELIVEVINAKNIISNEGTISGGTFVMLCDINTNTYVNYWNATVYGNGFTYSLKDAPTVYNSKQGHGILITKNSTLDNIRIVGDVYDGYGVYTEQNYFNAAIDAVENTTIQNCYIANCSTPVKARSDVKIVNSTLYGGAVANLIIMAGTVTLEDVTTVNYADERAVVGLGVAVHRDATEGAKLILEGSFTQYNYINEADKPNDSNAKTLYEGIFNGQCEGYYYGQSPNRWINTGIVSMTDKFGRDNIVDKADTGYEGTGVTLSGNKGYLYSEKNPSEVNNNYKEPAAIQSVVAPEYAFDFVNKNYIQKQDGNNDYCYEENGTVNISMDAGETFNWDTSILTVTKAGKMLDYTVVMDGVDYTGKNIAFNASGEYIVTYSYTDADNYTLDSEGNITTYSKKYAKSVRIIVTVVEATTKYADFKFGSNGTETEKLTIGNRTYISAKGVTADDSKWASMTIDGQKVYYPIVAAKLSATSGRSCYAYFPVFDTVVTITDYEDGKVGNPIEYNASTTSKPNSLSAVKGYYAAAADITWSNLTEASLNQSGPTKIFKWASGSDAPSDPTTYNIDSDSVKELCFKSPSIEKDREKYITLVQYTYTDQANQTYYYYVGYTLGEFDYTSCVTADTLVTLADGTQKRIDQVAYADQLLVWDFDKGEYTTAYSSIIENHGYDWNDVIVLNFEDGTSVKVVNVHGFFDADLNEWVDINATNVPNYIGHYFTQLDGDGYKQVKLVSASVSKQYIEGWSVLTAEYYNCFLEGMFSITPPATEQLAFFEIGEGMKYDAEAKLADIEKYGLYTYEEWAGMMTKEQFDAFKLAEIKIAVGKGLITYDEVLWLVKTYIPQ